MHFAYPARKSSNPLPYTAQRSRLPKLPAFRSLRRNHLRLIVIGCLAFFAIIYFFRRPQTSHGYPAPRAPSGNPPVVLVTVMDETKYGKEYTDLIEENRQAYADKHGYKTLFPRIGAYDLKGSPFSWTKVVAMRHALTLYPDCTYIWYLGQDGFIMDGEIDLHEDIMKPSKLEPLMMKDYPVVPPDSIIRTFGHLRARDIDLVLTQDKDGLSGENLIVRNGEWAKFFLDTWFDPIYRSYNFQKAESHALEHIVQWHPTILSRLALVPQRTFNSYSNDVMGEEYQPGDFVVRFAGCNKVSTKGCESDAEHFADQWRTAFKASGE